jgi:hypothetical protein
MWEAAGGSMEEVAVVMMSDPRQVKAEQMVAGVWLIGGCPPISTPPLDAIKGEGRVSAE